MAIYDLYIKRIEQYKKGNMDLYKEALTEVFGKEIEWSELKKSESGKQIRVMFQLEDKVKIKNSPIDIEKMARAIQGSRSGAGGCAITNFKCAFCGEEESWSNTATPKICKKCATQIARNIAINSFNFLLKDEYQIIRKGD